MAGGRAPRPVGTRARAETVATNGLCRRAPRRLDARALVGLCLLVLAAGGSLAFWARADDARAVLIATRDLPVGATLTASDLAVTRVRLEDPVYAAAVPAEELPALVGRVLAEPVHASQLLARAQLAARPPLAPGQVVITIPLAAPTAAGGRVRPGDRVAVLVTTGKGRPESRTCVVLERAAVYDVGYEARGPVIGDAEGGDRASRGAPVWLALSGTLSDSRAIAHARHNGELDVVLLPPEP
jgi:Flp pilus assembly protein CpaB